MSSKLSKIITYLNQRIFYIWLLLFAFFSTLISPENSLPYAIFSTFILYHLIYTMSEKLFTAVILFLTITLCLYYPIYAYYGELNSGIVAAFFETNVSESFDFLQKISIDDLIIPFLFVFSCIILMRLKKFHQKSPINKQQKILNIVLSGVFIFSLVYIPTKYYLEGAKDEEDERKWTLANSPVNVVSFYANIHDSIREYFDEKQELESMLTKPNPWQVESVSPKYQNYVLIIGESARRDYFSAFGFHLPTTPFLDTSKGYFNAGYVSSAPATYHSLLKSLYFKKGKTLNYAYNIVSLAKAANIETSWLSNQGSIGRYDTMASRVGVSADFSYFTKKGGFNTKSVDDMQLLDELALKLNTPPKSGTKSRLFVLHVMGSHRNFCDRVTEEERKLTFINKEISCYVNSILKTDTLIRKTVDLLKEKNQSYSVIYFSDHGLNHINKDKKESIHLDYDSKFESNYEVPFVKISSDDTKRIFVNTKRSAFNFIYGFSEWLGVKTKELDPNYHFFSDKEDEKIKIFNFHKTIDFNTLEKDKVSSLLDKKE
ncbi:Putative phosphoethanolamine transferase ybiP [Phocoenobacter uteri]|uniref:Phosphoethanolamine transferase ybiP n=1 Tax=Phocoenobacter uteri TaxID=146806 RepID=A0A379C8I9_9PAST|nr:phosphoethanolamine transferase [Phocoenobacter uteri]MDG6881927.1 hypothetical protein [Phocoenobacter uteri]SUB58075.1 Putative phosphoethanolamine transferase ybiP [Phocoenobacter uteri]